MNTLKALVEKNHVVWMYCRTKELSKQFLRQCEDEGFLALNGQKPTELGLNDLFGINHNMTMGYLMRMCWALGDSGAAIDVGTGEHVSRPVRIDYEKYLEGGVKNAFITLDRNYKIKK